jgi:Protein of Unknown function (DUF2784)
MDDALADGVLVLHAAFVLFVVGGQVVILAGWLGGWAWTRGLLFRLLHLCSIGFVVLEAWFGVPCPLTILENDLRLRAGEAAAYQVSFIGYWVGRLLYYTAPPWVFTTLYTAFSLLVVATFVWYPPQRRGTARSG